MENSVHILHKHIRNISNTERHHLIFIVSISCPKGRLLHILILHLNLMVT
ncbi:hypothetical protein MtrunA17_Chr3g0094181 [Medicago truncatula]|uniref:Uncharacterized protein n=1 Tax=Medicago truncatula TaxID=3880 RepID=A0A396IRX4_MEDTR|nr:hypothetical protein MtrunA17_Chr3g0094181 [Medicago truncatula]